MRERPIYLQFSIYQLRITPARAGKTAVERTSGFDGEDHPRSCGKDSQPSVVVPLRSGSPPARAGKTGRRLWKKSSQQDHPRSCGKDLDCGRPAKAAEGSPPLVRERRIWSNNCTTRIRITPARAGKTILMQNLKTRK